MLLFCVKTVVRESDSFELARLKKEEEEEVWRFSNFLVRYSKFAMVFVSLGVFLARKIKMNSMLS